MTLTLRPPTLVTGLMIGLLASVATGTADAGVQQWTANGPPGAAVNGLAIDPVTPSTVYMVGPGVWKSTDAGASWSRLTTGLTTSYMRVVAVNPDNPQVVLIGTWDAGIFRSANGGATWSAANDGLPDVKITAVTIDPSTPSTVYCGVRYQGAFKSTDGGRSWSPVNNGLEGNVTVTTLAVDPNSPQTILGGTYDGGILTTNGGASWSLIGGGLPSRSIETIHIDPTNSSIVYAGLSNKGVYKSTDGGATWNATNDGLGNRTVEELAIDPITPTTVHLASDGAGIFKSTDGGVTWTQSADVPPVISVNAIALNPSSPQVVYAGTYAAGVFKSTNGGETWHRSNTNLNAADARQVVVDPMDGTRLWTATRGGVFTRTDGSATWTSRNGDLPIINSDALARDPHDLDTVYLGTWRGVYKTTNGGTNWALTPSDPIPRNHEAVATHPVVADRVYAGNGTGLLVSEDGGETWEQPETGPIGMRVVSFGFDPRRPQTVYAGAWRGIFRSDDFGETWSSSLDEETIWSIAVDPMNSNTVYVCTYNGVFKSINGGATWTPATTGITSLYCWALAADPNDSSILYQGSGAGVFRTENGGASWAPFPGLEEYNVYDLTFSADGNTLYAGTDEGGVAAYTFGGSGCTLDCSTIVPETSFANSEVYFQAVATPTGCTSGLTYEWDFGDSSPHSSQQNPGHAYSSAGTYPWSVTVRSGSATCSSNGVIEVAPQATTWYVPAAAHSPGAGGTSWRTDFAAVNSGAGPADLTLTFIRYLGGAPITRQHTLAAGQTVEWQDVLVSLFGVSATGTAKGTISVGSSTPVAITARTYNQASTGTYGQYMPALPGTDAVARASAQSSRFVRSGEVGVIPHLKNTADSRSNLGVQNLGTAPVTVEVRLFSTTGAQIGTTLEHTVAIGRYWQQDDVFSALGAGSAEIAYATVVVLTNGGTAWFYGSVVDNNTGDPTTVPVLTSRAGTGGIAGVAHAPGAGGTEWRTDIAAVYLGSGTLQFQPSFTIYGGGAFSSSQARIPARNTKEWRDVLVSLFERDAGNPVKGTTSLPSIPDLYVTARTYNQTPAGTFGQYLPAVTAAEGFGEDSVAIIPQLKKNAAYRSNVGVLNLSGFEVTARIRLHDDTGAGVGTSRDLTIPAHEYLQIDDIMTEVGVGTVDLAYATIEVVTVGGRVWAYGSVVDNATGDPTTIPALVP